MVNCVVSVDTCASASVFLNRRASSCWPRALSGRVGLVAVKAGIGADKGAREMTVRDIPDDLRDGAGKQREIMIEAVAECHDDVLEKFIEGEEVTNDEIKMAIRKGTLDRNNSVLLQGFDVDESSDKTVAEQLRDALSKAAVRVVDLFRAWDEDKSGTVDKKEFTKAVRSLGFDVKKVRRAPHRRRFLPPCSRQRPMPPPPAVRRTCCSSWSSTTWRGRGRSAIPNLSRS